MTFADEQAKQSTRRFMLAKITYAKDLEPLLVDQGSSIWGTTFDPPVAIDSVIDGATTLSLTTSTSPTTGQYYYNEDTGIFKCNLGIEGTPLYSSATCAAYVSSRETGVVTNQDPENTSSQLRLWEPRLVSDPSIRESVKNAFAGVFTLEEISIELHNSDRWFQGLVAAEDSFRDKDVKVWLCLGTADNVRRVFTGKSRQYGISSDTVSIDVYDAFSLLDQACYFGDVSGEAIYLKNGGFFDNLDPSKHGKPCRLIAGSFSRYKQKPGGVWPWYPAITFDGESSLNPDFMEEAHCIDFTSTVGTTTNRTWGICRTIDGLRNIVVGTRSGSPVNSGSLNALYFTNTVWATMDLQIGDTVAFGTGAYGRVVQINTVGSTKEVWFRNTRTISTPAIVNATSITVHAAIELVIVDSAGVCYYPMYGRDYTIDSSTTTSGGNVFHKIVFTNSFETVTWNSINWFGELADPATPGLDPGRHKVYFKVRPVTTNLPHGAFLKKLCQKAGLTANAASFTAADAAFTAKSLQSIPWFDQDEYGTYREYAEAILESTLGYLSVNVSGEVVYELVAAIAATDTRDDNLVMRDSVAVNVDYNDIVIAIIAYNSHDYSDESNIGASSATSESTRGFYLHGVTTIIQQRHYLDTIAARLDDIVEIRSRPVTTYSWTTETEDLDTAIADDLTLESDQVLGGSGSVAVKVIALEKSTNGVNVTAVQIQGV